MITGVHHFSLIASSEASIDFYSSLGFREYKRIERKYDTVVLMNGHGMGLEIYIDPSHPPRESGPGSRKHIYIFLNFNKEMTNLARL